MVWATPHFQDQFGGQNFILFTDHKPMQTCANVPANKTLMQLQQLALEFNFVIQHKKGINMLADFLSWSNLEINTIQLMACHLATKQSSDVEIQALKYFRAAGRWPATLHWDVRHSMAQKETSFNTDIHGQFWVKTPHGDRNLLYARLILRMEIIQEAHGSLMSGHNAIECTINHIKTSWWWA